MRLLAILFIIIPTLSFSQVIDCVKTSNTPFHELSQRYPFNQAVRVLAISYITDTSSSGILLRKIDYSLPTKNDTICYSKLHEIKALRLVQINVLTDILYNYEKKIANNIDEVTMCFRPRNALIFINEKNESFAYLEICFECSRTRSSHINMGLDDNLCFKQYELLKTLFTNVGISYGVNTTIADN